MKPSAFAYHDPRSSDDLIALLTRLAPPISMHPVSPEQILEWINKTKT